MSAITGFGAFPSAAGGNPLAGMSMPSGTGSAGSLSGMLDGGNGLGIGADQSSGGSGAQGGAAAGAGAAPLQPASQAQGASFGDTLRSMIVDGPSATRRTASDLTARFAAGENIDPHQIAIASAKAGVEIQMATRTISSAVSAVRTLFQMQI